MAELDLLIKTERPHIIGINEALPKNHNRKIYPEEFHIDGYEVIMHPNISKNMGRGSLLYIHNSISYKQVLIDSGGQEFQEGLYAEIKLNSHDSLLCACIYRRGESDNENNEKLFEIFRKISNGEHSHILIMGDFNLKDINWHNLTCPGNNPDDLNHTFIECIRDCYFFQHITEPTRQRGTDTPSTLDLIFTNEEHMIEDINIEAPLGNSDHSILKFKFKCSMQNAPPKMKTMLKKGNYARFNELMKSIDWKAEFDQYPDDINRQWDFFKSKYLEAEAQCIPKKLVYVDGKLSKKFSIPLDRANLKKIKKKNKLWSKKRKEMASEEEKLQYNKLRNQIRRLTRKGKKIMEKNIAKEAKSNPKNFWKYTQSKLKTRVGIPDLVMSDTEDPPVYTKTDQEKAEVFLNYFSSVFTNEPPDENMPSFANRNYSEVISNINITEEIIKKKLTKIKVNKSPGPDAIHPRVLREITDSITTPITYIFSTSLRCMTLPSEWKHANVSSIFKKGKKTVPQNYRPVSLTCILCKIMESIIRDYVVNHMNKNKLFSDKQFGFISGRSTTLQLLHVLSIWCEILDEGGTIDVIYCDFMKAFDKVPHKRLLYKIEKYGIVGNIHGWIESFLSNRTQCVVINDEISASAPVTSGIPQGSVLGPLLFVIYINDMPEVVDTDSYVFLFADDTKVFRHMKNEKDTLQLQKDIENLVDWSNKWLLKFHPDKCVSMAIRSKNKQHTPHSYKMGHHTLAQSCCEKDIGVHIDEHLSFDTHINTAINKANRILAITRKTFDYMNPDMFTQIFKSLVRPHLEYAAAVWNPHKIYQKEAIENVQRRATKLIPGLSHLSYPERLKKLKIPTLAFRRERGDMIQTYKLTTDFEGYDKSLPSILKFSSTELRGHNKKLYVQGCNKDIKKYSFPWRITTNWNNLPRGIVNSENTIEFEKGLDNFWQGQELLYNNFKADIEHTTKEN